jgi:hypothetical protein
MDSNLLASQVTLGAVLSWGLQVLKNSKWFPVLQENSARIVKVLFSVVTSLGAVTGLSFAYNATAHTLLIGNLSWAMVLPSLWHWLTQFVIQEGWYQAVFNKATVVPVANEEQAAVSVSPATAQKISSATKP